MFACSINFVFPLDGKNKYLVYEKAWFSLISVTSRPFLVNKWETETGESHLNMGLIIASIRLLPNISQS